METKEKIIELLEGSLECLEEASHDESPFAYIKIIGRMSFVENAARKALEYLKNSEDTNQNP